MLSKWGKTHAVESFRQVYIRCTYLGYATCTYTLMFEVSTMGLQHGTSISYDQSSIGCIYSNLSFVSDISMICGIYGIT